MALISVSNNALQNITAVPASIPSGALVLLSTQTASSSASISFTSGIDSTYDSYVFKFIDIHPSSDGQNLMFNMSTDGGSNYNVIKTTTFFYSAHNESDSGSVLSYWGARDLAQSTSDAWISDAIGNGADENGCGDLILFNPSSTTYVKHFINKTQIYYTSDYSTIAYVAGYGNTTSAVNAVIFRMSGGNFDGIIKMYGVK